MSQTAVEHGYNFIPPVKGITPKSL